MDSSKYFITFANKNYMSTNRIYEQAKDLGVFNKILQLNEENIPDFIKKHDHFIKENKPGFGLWIWKPKIIYDTLNKMELGDILVYCDAGTFINKKGKERFNYYIRQLEKYDMVVFATSNDYKAQNFVKNDAIMNYYPDFNNQWIQYCYAGVIIIKKTEKSVKFVEDWLGLCENHNFIDKNPSIKYRDFPHYLGNDCDNGLFNLCLAKHKIHFTIIPDEINLYTSDNIQVAHTNLNQKNVDWSSLDHIPFQVRRMTPKFGY